MVSLPLCRCAEDFQNHAQLAFVSVIFTIVVGLLLFNFFVTKKVVTNPKKRYTILFTFVSVAMALGVASVCREIWSTDQSAEQGGGSGPRSWSGCRLINHVVLFPHRLVCLPFLSVFWFYTIMLTALNFIRTFAFLYYMCIAGAIEPLLMRFAMIVLPLLFFVTMCRIFELEYFRRLEYQVCC